MLKLLLLIAAQGTFQVDGLEEGERFRALVSSPQVNLAEERFGRVVDAHTGYPVESARIETWTEEISAPGQGFHRVGYAPTGSDGNFRVRIRDGEIVAEKAIVRARGYLSYPTPVGELDFVRLMPKPDWTTRIQVVDFKDRPIVGARITSTYSCAHDVPAFDVRTDVYGVAELGEYGLQDQTGELRIRAAGYAALKYVDWTEVPADTKSGKPALIRLARQRGVRARVLTSDGTQLPDQALYALDGDGYHVPTTDGAGNFEIESCYASSLDLLRVLPRTGEENLFLSPGPYPRDREINLRVNGDEWPEDLARGTLAIEYPRDDEIPIGFFHKDGWTRDSLSIEAQPVPAGEFLLRVGATFSGWEEEVVEASLEEGGHLVLELEPKREPELTILVPAKSGRVIVQAGDQSIELRGKEEQVITVPASKEIIVLCEGARTRRLVLGPIRNDSVADLRPETCLLPATHAQLAETAPRDLLFIRVTGGGPEGDLYVEGVFESEAKRLADDEFQVQVPVGYPLAMRYLEDGFAQCWLSVKSGVKELTLNPTRLASLVFDNQTGDELTFESIDEDELTALNPGPFSVLLRFEDGRRGLISLELEPGEERTLTLRD